MTCEKETMCVTWEVQMYEPASRVWICKGYGRATTSADPADIARAVLAGYLTAMAPRGGDVWRALARPDTGDTVTVGADELPDGAWQTDPAVQEALPGYLRGVLAD